MTRAIDLEDWLSEQGASRQNFGDAGTHNPAGHIPKSTWNRILKAQAAQDENLMNRRDLLRSEYARLVEEKEIRPLTYVERLVRTANGNDENESVKAARRLCEKKGIDYEGFQGC